MGSWVWVLRPKAIVGPKLDAWWKGPYRITHRTGEDSFRVENTSKDAFDVHRSQLKIYECTEEMASIFPLCFRLHGGQPGCEIARKIHAILGHRRSPRGGLKSLTQWVGIDVQNAVWEPLSIFMGLNCQAWDEYSEKFSL